MSCLLPRSKLQRVTFFMKRSYLLPRENFKPPYLPNHAYWDPGICTQLRSSHIHPIHQKSHDFINGIVVYLALICAVWSGRGRAGKKVTAITFFRCPTVEVALECMFLRVKILKCMEWHWSVAILWTNIIRPRSGIGVHTWQKLSYGSGNGVYTPLGVHFKWCWSVFQLVSNLSKSMEWHPSVHLWYSECGWSVHSGGSGNRVALECTLQAGVYTPSR